MKKITTQIPTIIQARFFAVLMAVVLFVNSNRVAAASIQSNGTGGGIFGAAATWVGLVVPGTSDTAVIVTGDTVVLSGVTTLAGLRIMPSAKLDNNGYKLILNSSSKTYYILYGEHNITGNVENNLTGSSSFIMIGPDTGPGGLMSGTGQFRINDCVWDTVYGIFNIPDADIIVGYNSGCGGARLYNYATITMTNGSFTVAYTHILYNYGTISMENGDIKFGSSSAGATVYNYGNWQLTYGSVDYLGSGTFRNQSSGALTLQNGNIKMTSTGGDFSNNGITTILAGYITSNSSLHRFYNNSGGTLNIGGVGTPISTFLNFRFIPSTSGSNTVNYTGAGTQQIHKPVNTSGTLTSYWHLKCSNIDIKEIDGYDLKILGDLTIRDAAVLDASNDGGISNYNIDIKGNWYDSSLAAQPFIPRDKKVTFNGITSQTIVASNNGKETYYNVVVNKPVDSLLVFNDSITVSANISLVSGIVDLNQNTLILENPNTTAISGGSDTSYIKSEDETGNNQSRVQWNVQDTTGTYTIPFGLNNAGTNYYIPFTFNVSTPGAETNPGSGYFSVSTYSTTTSNTPLPIYPDSVTQAYDPLNAVDRFWQIDAEGYSDNPTADLTFTYPDPEKPDTLSDDLVAQHWNTSTLLWDAPASAQTYTASTTYTTTGAVTISSVNTFSPWTLARKNNYLKCPEIQKPVNSTICYGDTIILSTLTSPAGFYTQTWSPAAGLTASTGELTKASPGTGSTTYTVSGNDGAGCYNNQTISIEVNPLPTLTGTANTELCYGNDTTLSVSGGVTYTWSPATYLNSATSGSVIFSLAPVGSISYTVTGYNQYNCINTHTFSVTVHQLPIVNAGSDQFICLNDSASLNATGSSGNYTWSPGIYFSSNTGTSVTAGFPVIANTYSCNVLLVDINNCSANDTVIVTVVTALIANAGADVSMLCGSSTTLSGSGGLTFAWSPETGLTPTNSSMPVFDPTAIGMLPGTYTYSLIVASGIGCVSAPDEVIITVDSIQANAGTNQSICTGSSADLTGTGGQTYTWWPETGLSSTDTNNTNFNLTEPGIYSYTLTASSGVGCESTDSVSITVIAIPTVSAGADITIRPDQSDTLHAEGNAQNYSWTPNACSNCLDPVVFPSATTPYILTASNAFCTATDTVIAHYVPYPCDIYIPNAFSPNNDGENDKVQVYSHCLKEEGFVFRIFDRWGTMVFETYEQDKSWDGTYGSASLTTGSGNEKNTAVFVYQLQATTINLDNISRKGNISLVR